MVNKTDVSFKIITIKKIANVFHICVVCAAVYI